MQCAELCSMLNVKFAVDAKINFYWCRGGVCTPGTVNFVNLISPQVIPSVLSLWNFQGLWDISLWDIL